MEARIQEKLTVRVCSSLEKKDREQNEKTGNKTRKVAGSMWAHGKDIWPLGQ